MKMKLNILKKISSKEITVVASLPDMGKVGGLVSSFLAQNLKTELVAEILSAEKPWVLHEGGVVKSAGDIYKIFYDKSTGLIILTGESQPQDSRELYNLCNTFLDYVQSVGKVGRLYAAGGYLREQLTGAPRVCAVVNKEDLKKILARYSIEPIGSEITSITWFNGLILGLAAERGIEGIGFFGEISDTTIPQPLAAKSILAALGRIENIKLDTKLLDQQYESILEEMEKQKKQPSGFGPGIG